MARADEGAGGDSLSFDTEGTFAIARDGTWYHEGRPILRKELVKLFSTVLTREEDGLYWLKTPVEKARVHVEDAPFLAEEMERRETADNPILAFRTNIGEWVEAGPENPIRVNHAPDTGEPTPYILVKPGLDALIVRSVFYEMAALAEARDVHGEKVLGVWSHGRYFPLGPAHET